MQASGELAARSTPWGSGSPQHPSGLYIGFLAFAVYLHLLQSGVAEGPARNILLLLRVLFENVHAFSCRSESRSVFRMPIRGNPLLLVDEIAKWIERRRRER